MKNNTIDTNYNIIIVVVVIIIFIIIGIGILLWKFNNKRDYSHNPFHFTTDKYKMETNRRIELNIKKQNWNTVKIYLKFWAPHQTRNQDKCWYQETITTTFEKGIEELRNFIISNYSEWISNDKQFINWYYSEFKSKAMNLEGDEEFKIPNFIKLWEEKRKINEIKNKINIYENRREGKKERIQNLEARLIKKNKSQFWSKIFVKTYKLRIESLKENIEILNKEILTINSEMGKLSEQEKNTKIKVEKYSLPTQYFKHNVSATINQKAKELTWLPMKNFDGSNLKNVKGVYIFWNKSKNKYYVGQSKNLYNRICVNHLSIKRGEVKNLSFREDYNNGDFFYIATTECSSKDELDEKEKYYINLFDSCWNGYNKTQGNT